MAVSLNKLKDLLIGKRWFAANEETRALLSDMAVLRTDGAASSLRALDQCWAAASGSHFGFAVQTRIWAGIAPGLDANDPWQGERFRRFGERLGWRGDDRWMPLAGVLPHLRFSVSEPKEPYQVPPGCFPFHNVLATDNWQQGFSPRDCWGEHLWYRWLDVFAVEYGAGDR